MYVVHYISLYDWSTFIVVPLIIFVVLAFGGQISSFPSLFVVLYSYFRFCRSMIWVHGRSGILLIFLSDSVRVVLEHLFVFWL